jgi:uncharacterized membrane protein
MRETLLVLVGWLLFGGSHLLLSHGGIRENLRRRLTPMGFNGIYALVALPAFWVLVTSYFYHRHAGPRLWDLRTSPPALHFVELIMLLSFFLMIASFAMPSPTSMDPRGRFEVRGLLRITRHPFLMGAALFGLAHCLPNGYPSDLAFFGGFTVFALAGAYHQDARKRREAAAEHQPFFEQTSVLPFAAILQGKQPLVVRDLPWVAGLLGVALALVIRWYHAKWFAIPLLG